MRVTARGIAEKDAELKAMIDRVKSLKPAMERGAQDLKTLIYKTFKNSVTPYGVPFEPLKPETIKRRRRGSAIPLVDTGKHLRDKVAVKAFDKSISFGVNTSFAATHQFGDPSRNIPQRQFLPSDGLDSGPAAETKALIFKRIRNFILKGKP